MALEMQQLNRVFIYGSARLPDPDPNMTVDEVKSMYSAAYPEILTSEVTGPTQAGLELEYEFRKAVGTKG